MLQFLNNELAWWFNVGVQIFLCISGFLYGQREIGEITKYYGHKIKKILVPYLIAFIPFGIAVFIFANNCFSWRSFALGLFASGTINGGNHLWFVSYIIMCYLITPILEAYRDRYVDNEKSMWAFVVSSVLITSIFFGIFNRSFSPAWMSCYVIGYVLGINEKNRHIKQGILILLITLLALIFNSAQVYIDYIACLTFEGKNQTLYQYYCQYSHVFLGVFMFLLMKTIFDRMNIGTRIKSLLNISDNYSYEIYLVHHFIILGPFSLMAITPITALNIMIILAGVIVMALALKRIEIFVLR